jgi:hypothetical protein
VMAGPTLSEIRLVLTVKARAEVRSRKAVSDAEVNFTCNAMNSRAARRSRPGLAQ